MDDKPVMLIVDDVEINRVVLAQFFQDDFTILEAENGQQALDIMEEQPVSIVLVDLVMPVMDGYEFLSVLQRNDQYQGLPVVVMTAQSDGDSEVRAMELGAADFITKPCNPTIVRCRVRNVMGRTENEWRRIEQLASDRQMMEMTRFIEQDQLTGAYNREAFYKKASQMMLEHRDTLYEIVYLDIDCFKVVNDLFNLETGNLILKTAGYFLQVLVGNRGLCCRMEADHFVLCMPRDHVKPETLLEALDGAVASLNISHSIVFYAGIYEVDNPLLAVDQMCDRARMAMSKIKGNYMQRYGVYDESMRELMLEEQMIARDMEFALQSKQFSIFVQPIYDTLLGKVVSAEALVRWQHPLKGLISPARFIPVFERNGFIVRLDRYVWEEVCKMMVQLRETTGMVIPVSVNVSRLNLYNLDLLDFLMGLVKKYQLSPELLHLEITETAYTRNPQQLVDEVNMFRQNGFKIFMDDFGNGYSSLNMLKDLPVDTLKIDLGFVQNVEFSGRAGIIMKSVVDMADQLGMEVVVEGVENQAQLNFVRSVGCRVIQGYYYSKPLPADEFWQMQAKGRGTIQ